MELQSLHNAKEGGIVWCLKKVPPTEYKQPSEKQNGNLWSILVNQEKKFLLQAKDLPERDEGWVRRLRKVAKALIKIKCQKTSTLHEDLGVNREEYRTFFSREGKVDEVSTHFINTLSCFVEKELVSRN